MSIFYGSNYTVSNNIISKNLDTAIKAQALSNITIANNSINRVRSGIYVAGSQTVNVWKNNLEHIQGNPRGNFVQFN